MQIYLSRSLIVIILLLLSGFSFFTPTWESIENQIQEDFPLVKHVEIDELSRIMAEEKILLIDVREADEFAISQIQGARNIESPEKVHTDEQTRIVVYCSVGYRSARFAQDLQERGFQNVANLRGSIFAWANQGYPLYQGSERTNKVHPFNKKWGRLLDEKYHLYPNK
ncbi:MAG: rhodanese-like domain-containing protein [Desulfocapsaceae bacterium]|nr:rhodanese-like domain-containing protein [Desulfocapsaceae bacterium]